MNLWLGSQEHAVPSLSPERAGAAGMLPFL